MAPQDLDRSVCKVHCKGAGKGATSLGPMRTASRHGIGLAPAEGRVVLLDQVEEVAKEDEDAHLHTEQRSGKPPRAAPPPTRTPRRRSLGARGPPPSAAGGAGGSAAGGCARRPAPDHARGVLVLVLVLVLVAFVLVLVLVLVVVLLLLLHTCPSMRI